MRKNDKILMLKMDNFEKQKGGGECNKETQGERRRSRIGRSDKQDLNITAILREIHAKREELILIQNILQR
jgi:hypothetical protein